MRTPRAGIGIAWFIAIIGIHGSFQDQEISIIWTKVYVEEKDNVNNVYSTHRDVWWKLHSLHSQSAAMRSA